jgi:hypothetical protein
MLLATLQYCLYVFPCRETSEMKADTVLQYSRTSIFVSAVRFLRPSAIGSDALWGGNFFTLAHRSSHHRTSHTLPYSHKVANVRKSTTRKEINWTPTPCNAVSSRPHLDLYCAPCFHLLLAPTARFAGRIKADSCLDRAHGLDLWMCRYERADWPARR